MWNEISYKGIEESTKQPYKTPRQPLPAKVLSVEAGSIGEELGFEPGDQISRINGVRPRDLIDYQYLITDDMLCLEIIDKNGALHNIELEKEIDDPLGLAFTEALFDGLKQCNNSCPFCFIDQQPPGHRKSLYFKDDDYRLSFLYGSYLTLTNLNPADWQRIEEQRLSPLFVSVHTTDPDLRSQLLGNNKAKDIIDQLSWFSEKKLQLHAQIVVCPGINNGKALEKTLFDLSKFAKGAWPAVLSAAVVPVGLTRFRPLNDGLKPVNPNCAKAVISQVEALQKQFEKDLGSRFAWLSDEWYLIAGKPLPIYQNYENFPQQENGVGTIRSFLKEMNNATTNLPKKLNHEKKCSWVVGQLVKEALSPVHIRLNAIKGLTLNLYGLPSPYWGQDQVVTGLLTGSDLIQGLKGHNLGNQLLLPSIMLREGEPIFLDDMTLQELSQTLKIPVRVVHGADDIVAAALQEVEETL